MLNPKLAIGPVRESQSFLITPLPPWVPIVQNATLFFHLPNRHLQNDGNDFSWYRSRATYTRNATDTLVAGSNYNMVSNLKNVDTFNSNYLIRHDTVLDTTSVGSKNLANMLDTDDIMFFSIGSDSGSSVGNVECIISKFRLQLETGICEFVFSNTHVFVDYMKQKQIELWRSFFGTSATDNPFISNYQIPLPDYSVR